MSKSKKKKNMTEKALAANRRNAQFSPGPLSPEGKEISCMNPRKKDVFTVNIHLLPYEDRKAFFEFHDALLNDLCPQNALEMQWVSMYILESWHYFRLEVSRVDILNRAEFRDDLMRELDNHSIYQRRSQNIMIRALKQIGLLKDRRKATLQERQALSQAGFHPITNTVDNPSDAPLNLEIETPDFKASNPIETFTEVLKSKATAVKIHDNGVKIEDAGEIHENACDFVICDGEKLALYPSLPSRREVEESTQRYRDGEPADPYRVKMNDIFDALNDPSKPENKKSNKTKNPNTPDEGSPPAKT